MRARARVCVCVCVCVCACFSWQLQLQNKRNSTCALPHHGHSARSTTDTSTHSATASSTSSPQGVFNEAFELGFHPTLRHRAPVEAGLGVLDGGQVELHSDKLAGSVEGCMCGLLVPRLFPDGNRRLTSMVDPLHESDLIATRWREGWLPPYCCQNAMALMVLAACCTVGSLNCPVLFLYSYSYLRCGGMRRACCRGCRASCC